MKLSDLKPDIRNANAGTSRGRDMVERSLRTYGAGRSILVDKHGQIIAGNKTTEAAAAIGLDDVVLVPTDGRQLVVVQRTDLDLDTDAAARELAIVDNRAGELGLEWDADVLASLGEEIDLSQFWGRDELEALIGKTVGDGGDEFDTTPAEGPTRVQSGEVWQLGRHRVLCGDSTKREDVERVMAGETVSLLLTDPPYGVGVVGTEGNIGGDTKYAKAGTYQPVHGDDRPFDPAHLFSIGKRQVVWGANYFCTLLPVAGQWLVWDKNRPDGTTFSECELAWTNGGGRAVKKYKCTWDGFHREGESGKRDHPTQKPIKLMVDVIEDYSESDDIVSDLYLGSGTTLIACERTARRCYGIEIEPRYCDVILRRWEAETGGEAVRVDG